MGIAGGSSSDGQGRVARHRDVGRVDDARWCCCVQEGNQPLHLACKNGHWDAAKMLVEKGAPVDESTLKEAVKHQVGGVLRSILEHDAASPADLMAVYNGTDIEFMSLLMRSPRVLAGITPEWWDAKGHSWPIESVQCALAMWCPFEAANHVRNRQNPVVQALILVWLCRHQSLQQRATCRCLHIHAEQPSS